MNRRAALYLCALAFVVLLGYAIARPSTESLFLERHGAESLPGAWLAVAAMTIPVVWLYNRAAARSPLGRVMLGSIALSAGSLVLLLALRRSSGGAFALYVWKDVHIVVLLEALWSFANIVFETRAATWVYGLFCAAGSLGGLCGNLLVGVIAQRWGTENAPFALLPLFGIAAVIALAVARAAGEPAPQTREHIGPGDAVALVRKSPYVGWLVVLIGTVQVVITLIDYVYNDAIATAYPDTHERTAIIGRVYAAIDVASLTLQLASGVVIRFCGVGATLLAVPALLGGAVVAFAAAPRFILMAIAKVASKSFDYSLFRTAKEMLYIPLDYADKTRGKALADMLTYRVAKGAASLLLIGLAMLMASTSGASTWVTAMTLLGLLCWLAVTVVVSRRYRNRVQSAP